MLDSIQIDIPEYESPFAIAEELGRYGADRGAAALLFDVRNRRVTITVQEKVCAPAIVYHGTAYQWELSYFVDAVALRALIIEALPDFEKLAADTKIEYKDGNWRGQIVGDEPVSYNQAYRAIEAATDEAGEHGGVWTAQEWYEVTPFPEGVTADSTDEELKQLASELEAEALQGNRSKVTDVFEFLVYLREIAQNRRAAAKALGSAGGKKSAKVKTPAKTAASVANGKKGGRPAFISSTVGLNAYNEEFQIGGLVRFQFYSVGGGRIRIQPVKGLDLAKLSPVVDIPAEVFNARNTDDNVDEFRFAAQLCGYRIGGEE